MLNCRNLLTDCVFSSFQDKANDSAESVLTGMQMGWESPELSDDFMISDVESVPFDLSQASTIAVDEDSCSSVVNDLNSSSDTPPLKRQKAVRYVSSHLKKNL